MCTMSFASPLVPAVHLLISLHLLDMVGSLSSLEMKDLWFIERRSHSEFDLVQEFFNRTLLPSCDVTANVCDVNCCNDKDCNEENLEAFTCRKQPELFSVDPILSDSMYCYSNDTSGFDPVLCYETENSPFLGLYFMEDSILKRKSVEMNLETVLPSRYFSKTKPKAKLREKYKYGVPLRLEEGGLFSLPSDVVGKGYCDYDSPVRFLVGTYAVCSSEINPELCVENPKFQLGTYVKRNNNELEPPDISSGTDALMTVNITIQCGHDVDIDNFFVVRDLLEHCGNVNQRTQYDPVRQLCKHVVTQVEHHFTWEGNALVGLDVVVGLSEISTATTHSHVPSRRGRHARVSQTFKTQFHEKETKSTRSHSGSYNYNDNILIHHL